MKKRIIALLTAAVLLVPSGACSRKPKGSTLQIDLSTSYVSEPFDKNGIRYDIVTVTDKGYVCQRFNKLKNTALTLYDPEKNEWRDIHKNQCNLPNWTGVLPDGRLAALYNVSAGIVGGWYDFDGKNRVLEIYDDDLNVAEERKLPDSVSKGILQNDNIIADGDGNWYFLPMDDEMPDSVEVYAPDFSLKGKIPVGESYLNGLTVGRSGQVYGIGESGGSLQLRRLDLGSMTAEPVGEPITNNFYTELSAGPDYELYYYNNTGIYGLQDDWTPKLLVDFRNSNLLGFCSNLHPLPGGEFVIQYSKGMESPKLYRLRHLTEEELAGTQIITLAGVDLSESLVSNICDYNLSQTDVRIVMKDYADDYKNGEYVYYGGNWMDSSYYRVVNQQSGTQPYPEAAEAFKNDLLSGIVPDIICMDSMPYQQLSNKGLLTDLWPILEQDERFDPKAYYMTFLEGLKHGDKLERIGFSFIVDTAVARTDLVGAQQGRTPEEYIEMIESRPEGMDLIFDPSREYLTQLYLTGSQSSFIDRETMSCSFNSESFVKLLELTGSVKPMDEIEHSEEERREIEELGQTYWKMHRLITPLTLFAPYQYHGIHVYDYQNEDITLVGFPESAGGNGGRYHMNYLLSLTAQSVMQEQVMDYIFWELSPNRQNKVGLSSNTQAQTMPLHRDAFENYLKAANITTPFQSGASEEEMKIVREYVAGIRMYAENDPAISSIITEEAQKYYAGDQSAQQAAEMIQSRCTLYLSEQE